MLSNSKLTRADKAERKALLAQLPPGATLFTDGESLTVLAVPDGSVTRVFSSVASTNERKFRRKVGEYHALQRFFYDAAGGMILPGAWSAQAVVRVFTQ